MAATPTGAAPLRFCFDRFSCQSSVGQPPGRLDVAGLVQSTPFLACCTPPADVILRLPSCHGFDWPVLMFTVLAGAPFWRSICRATRRAAARPTVSSFMRLRVWSRTLGVASVQASVTSAIITRETWNCWGGYSDRGTPRANAWRAYKTGAAPESDPLATGACSIKWHWNVSASAVASQPRTIGLSLEG